MSDYLKIPCLKIITTCLYCKYQICKILSVPFTKIEPMSGQHYCTRNTQINVMLHIYTELGDFKAIITGSHISEVFFRWPYWTYVYSRPLHRHILNLVYEVSFLKIHPAWTIYVVDHGPWIWVTRKSFGQVPFRISQIWPRQCEKSPLYQYRYAKFQQRLHPYDVQRAFNLNLSVHRI